MSDSDRVQHYVDDLYADSLEYVAGPFGTVGEAANWITSRIIDEDGFERPESQGRYVLVSSDAGPRHASCSPDENSTKP